MHFLIEKRIDFLMKNGAHGEPKGTPKSRNFGVFSRLLPRTPPKTQNGPKMTPKWSQNGVKMEWKWGENGAKIKGKLSEHSSRTICVFWEFLQVSKRVFSWFIRAFLEFMWNFTETPQDFHRHSRGIRSEFVGKSYDLVAKPQGIHGKYMGDLVQNL